jgi:hypothetical protein
LSDPKPLLEICDRALEGRLVPQNPATQGSCARRVVPILAHSTMPAQIASSTSHVLVLRKIRIALLPERGNNLSSIGLDKHRIKFLLWNMALANGLQGKLAARFHLYLV